MSEPDVLTELDAYIIAGHPFQAPLGTLLRHARDEIVTLREAREPASLSHGTVQALIQKARAEALEEAACVCDQHPDATDTDYVRACRDCAAAIRALKEPP